MATPVNLNISGWYRQGESPYLDGSYPASDRPSGFTPEGTYGLSGTLLDGNTITITDSGSGFGTKPNGAKPLYYVELGENSLVNGSNSRAEANDFTWNSRCSLSTDQTASANRSHSLRMTWDQPGTGYVNSGSITTAGFQTGGSSDVYLFRRLRINADGTDLYIGDPDHYNLKGPRIWESVKTGKNIHGPTYGQNNEVSGHPRLSLEILGGTSYQIDDNGTKETVWGLRKNEWVADEWELHQGTTDVEDSTWDLWRNGIHEQYLHPSQGATFIARTTADPEDWTQVYLDQVQFHDDPGFQTYWWLDFVYVDDSFCRIVISEEPTWNAGSYTGPVEYDRELQIPLTWTAGTITFELRSGMFSTLSGKYLYVVDSAGTAVKLGQFS